jgi:hypothetical protein
MEVAGANRRWRCQFRCRGSRRESAVAQLFSLGGKTTHKIMQTQQTTKACRKGTAMWIGMSIGIAIGAAVGVAMQDVPQGVAIGVALGTAVGAAVTFAKPKRD